ncbi:type II restriction endonuclease [Lentzea roselyniae]|uniref:Type II restriction endonuclease n=1 Tax=Lentzea roselyniae TaxID=531940 RepID=A0ABP7ACW6_9PSEU
MTEMAGDQIARRIAASGASIYDLFNRDSDEYYDNQTLEERLESALVGQQGDAPIRTRSKLGKAAVTVALGYPVPRSFRKTQPRFPSQNLDLFLQQSNNLQIWNEEVDPERRYALVRLDTTNTVTAVRVVTGEAVALWDKTGTLTSKFQAARLDSRTGSKLVSALDTELFREVLLPGATAEVDITGLSPASPPRRGKVLPISEVHSRLLPLEGVTFDDPGLTNERGRGVVLQKLVTETLGVGPYGDKGQFPDILNQALEVKLQLSPTIDLGLVSPDSDHPAEDVGGGLRHRDVRYAVFFGARSGSVVTLDAVVTTTGADFFTEFRRFEGLVSNRKLQIPPPSGLFETKG